MMKIWTLMRATLLAGLLMGTAAAPAAVLADARARQPVASHASTRRMDWPLLAVAIVALVIGRTVVHRRSKSGDTPRR